MNELEHAILMLQELSAEGGNEDGSATVCSAKAAYHGTVGFCRVSGTCRECTYFKVFFQRRAVSWRCSSCRVQALPYVGEGMCEGCGKVSSYLSPVEVTDDET